MKKYISNGRKLTLLRGSAEWFNEDCPDIYDSDGNLVFHSDITSVYILNKEIKKTLYLFIKRSHDLFAKKYNFSTKTPQWIEKIKP